MCEPPLELNSTGFSLDSSNSKAREGLERVEKMGDVSIDNTYDTEVDILGASDNEVLCIKTS